MNKIVIKKLHGCDDEYSAGTVVIVYRDNLGHLQAVEKRGKASHDYVAAYGELVCWQATCGYAEVEEQ